jgi:hypothetical protein
MNKKEEEIILEEKPMVNGNMIELLGKVLDFNSEYLKFLKGELDIAKAKRLEEMSKNG